MIKKYHFGRYQWPFKY